MVDHSGSGSTGRGTWPGNVVGGELAGKQQSLGCVRWEPGRTRGSVDSERLPRYPRRFEMPGKGYPRNNHGALGVCHENERKTVPVEEKMPKPARITVFLSGDHATPNLGASVR